MKFNIAKLLLLSLLLSYAVIECSETSASGLSYNFLGNSKSKLKKSKANQTPAGINYC